MHPAERVIRYIRHHPLLQNQEWLWGAVRPYYNRFLSAFAKRGIERRFGGGPALRILPELRDLSEHYEEDIWRHLIGQIKPGDVAIDIGAHFGLYAMAMAHAVTTRGQVIAFEPDRENLGILKRHLTINGLTGIVEVVESAVGDEVGELNFSGDRSSVSRLAAAEDKITSTVKVTKLDTYFRDRAVDIIKMDVEGYEARVLKGAAELLADPKRRPRLLFIEMHPHIWAATGTSRDEILQLVERLDYHVEAVHGSLMDVDRTFEIAAVAKHPR